MRSDLELRSPAHGTGWADRWRFSGADERILRDCLDQLDEFATAAPLELYESHAHGHVIQGDRWQAAMLLWPDDPYRLGATMFEPRRAEQAWTAAGAIRLAEILPAQLDGLRDDIRRRFLPKS